MAESHLVRCTSKDARGARPRVIAIGGSNSDGTPWKMDARNAVTGIKTGKLKFYVNVEVGSETRGVWLGVEQQDGQEVLSVVDGDPALLLNLPDCP